MAGPKFTTTCRASIQPLSTLRRILPGPTGLVPLTQTAAQRCRPIPPIRCSLGSVSPGRTIPRPLCAEALDSTPTPGAWILTAETTRVTGWVLRLVRRGTYPIRPTGLLRLRSLMDLGPFLERATLCLTFKHRRRQTPTTDKGLVISSTTRLYPESSSG